MFFNRLFVDLALFEFAGGVVRRQCRVFCGIPNLGINAIDDAAQCRAACAQQAVHAHATGDGGDFLRIAWADCGDVIAEQNPCLEKTDAAVILHAFG